MEVSVYYKVKCSVIPGLWLYPNLSVKKEMEDISCIQDSGL